MAGTRVAMVVGGTSGIGRAVAVRLAESAFRVIVVGRDAERGAEVVAECAAAAGSPGGHSFMRCDASRIAAVRTCAAEVASREPRLDALVLSQGIASIAGRTETEEGLDTKLALHYFGRVAFVQALLPALRAAGDARVLFVLSAGVHGAYAHAADDFELRKHYSLKNAADAAGFYTDAACDSLAREPANAGVTFCHAAPGVVRTAWGTELPFAVRALVRCAQLFATPAADCAATLVTATLAPRAPGEGGLRLISAKGAAAAPAAGHVAAREHIWADTQALLARIPAQ